MTRSDQVRRTVPLLALSRLTPVLTGAGDGEIAQEVAVREGGEGSEFHSAPADILDRAAINQVAVQGGVPTAKDDSVLGRAGLRHGAVEDRIGLRLPVLEALASNSMPLPPVLVTCSAG